MKSILLFLITFLPASEIQLYGQSGTLDTSFGKKGIVLDKSSLFRSIAVQPDGKIVTGEYFQDSIVNSWFAVSRYTVNGIVDTSFGVKGMYRTFLGFGADAPVCIALQKDGKILEVGSCWDSNYNPVCALVRFDSSGFLDKSFNDSGFVFTVFDSGGGAWGEAVAEQSDGKIVVAAYAENSGNGNTGIGLVRFNVDGTLDRIFGNGGKVFKTLGNLADLNPSSIAIQADGKILVGGNRTNNNYDSIYFALFRYTSDGVLDNNYGNGGMVITSFGINGLLEQDYASSLVIDSSGKVILSGTAFTIPDTVATIAMARYNTDGTLDQTFGIGGKVRTVFQNNYNSGAEAIAIQADGKIIVSGNCNLSRYGLNEKPILVCYNSDGTLDNNFGQLGIVIANNVDSITMDFSDLTLQSDGKILTVGKRGIFRYLSVVNTGVLDFSLKENPILIYPNPISKEAVLQFTLSEDEYISLALYDMQGRIVQAFFYNQHLAPKEYEERLSLNSSLSAGDYILNISNGKSNQGVRVTKL